MSATTEISMVANQLGKPLDRNIYFNNMPLALAGSIVSPALVEHLQRLDPSGLVFTCLEREDAPRLDLPHLVSSEIRPGYAALLADAGIHSLVPNELRATCLREIQQLLNACRYLGRLDMAIAYEIVRQIWRHLRPVSESVLRLPGGFDPETAASQHALDCCALGMAVYSDCATDEAELFDLGLGLLLLDIGMTRVDQRLLTRKGALSGAEIEALKRHVQFGYSMAINVAGLNPRTARMILNHHERSNGSGYNQGLKEAELDNWDLLAAVVDSYSAMTANRLHRDATDQHRAAAVLVRHTGELFSTRMVGQLLHRAGRFPVGTIVLLSCGEIAVVSRINPAAMALPVVRVLFDEHGQRLSKVPQLDLFRDGCGQFIERALDLHPVPESLHL